MGRSDVGGADPPPTRTAVCMVRPVATATPT